jgi:hypothetical protein
MKPTITKNGAARGLSRGTDGANSDIRIRHTQKHPLEMKPAKRLPARRNASWDHSTIFLCPVAMGDL